MIVTMPTYGMKPLARPTTSFRSTHNCPGLYKPRSSTSLLSPLVRNLILPSGLRTQQFHKVVHRRWLQVTPPFLDSLALYFHSTKTIEVWAWDVIACVTMQRISGGVHQTRWYKKKYTYGLEHLPATHRRVILLDFNNVFNTFVHIATLRWFYVKVLKLPQTCLWF